MKIEPEIQEYGYKSEASRVDDSNSGSEFTDNDCSSQSSDSSVKENQPRSPVIVASHRATSDEYYVRRERNNMAVRKSRDKARQQQRESQRRLQELTIENKRLQMKAELLQKELVVLRGLFPSIGAIVPQEVEMFLAE